MRPVLLSILMVSLVLPVYAIELNSPNHHTIFAYNSGIIAANHIGLELSDMTIQTGPPEAVPGGYERTVTLYFEFLGATYEVAAYRQTLPVNTNPQTGAVTLIEPLPQPNPAAYLEFPLRYTDDGETFNILLRRQMDSLNLEIIELSLEPYTDPYGTKATSPPVATPFWYDTTTPFERVRNVNTPQLFHFISASDSIIIRFSRYRIFRSDPISGGSFAHVRQAKTDYYQSMNLGFSQAQEFTRPVSLACLNRKNPVEIYSYFSAKDNGNSVRTDLIWIPYNLKYGTGFYLEVIAEGPGVTMYSTPSDVDTFLRSIDPKCIYFGPGE